MPIYGRRPGRPDPGALIDWSRPLAQGLAFFTPLSEGSGLTLYDAATSGNLSLPVTAATWGQGSMPGLSCTSTTARAQITTPNALRLPGPLSIAVAYQQVGSPSANSSAIFGTTYAATSVAPTIGYGFYVQTTKAPRCFYNLGGASNLTLTSSATPASGSDNILSASIASGSQAFYLNGQLQSSSTNTGAVIYDATSLLAIGAVTTFARSPNVIVYWAAIWSRVLSAAEHATIGAAPTAVFGHVFAPPVYRLFGARSFRLRRSLYDRAGSRGVA